MRANEGACFCTQVGVIDKDCVCVKVYWYLLSLIQTVG